MMNKDLTLLMEKIRLVICLLVICSCVPGTNSEKKGKASCDPDSSFDSRRRACLPVTSPIGPPRPQTFSASLLEDSGSNFIILNYTDDTDDKALGCNILSISEGIDDKAPVCNCVNGQCISEVSVDAGFSGTASFSYIIRDDDGASSETLLRVDVISANDLPSATDYTVTVNEDDNFFIDIDLSSSVSDQDNNALFVEPLGSPFNLSKVSGSPLKLRYTKSNLNENNDSRHGSVTYGGLRFYRNTDVMGLSSSINIQFVPGVSLSVSPPVNGGLVIYIVDGVTTEGEVKQALDGIKASVNNTTGVFYEILGSRPITVGGATKTIFIPSSTKALASFPYKVCEVEKPTNCNKVPSFGTDPLINISIIPKNDFPDPSGQGIAYSAPPSVPASTLVTQFNITERSTPWILGDTNFNGVLDLSENGLPYASYMDSFIGQAKTGVEYFLSTTPIGGTLTNCMGLAGSESALFGRSDISCSFQFDSYVSNDNKKSSVDIDGLRFRYKTEGVVAGKYIKLTDVVSATKVAFANLGTGLSNLCNGMIDLNIVVGTTTSLDIKNFIESQACAGGIPFDIVMLGSVYEQEQGIITSKLFVGGRDYAASFTYRVDGISQSHTQLVIFDIPPVQDLPFIGSTAPTFNAIPEDGSYDFSLKAAYDPDLGDVLKYDADFTGLRGVITNCLGETGSDDNIGAGYVSSDLVCTFSPELNFSGTTTFSYTVSDDKGGVHGPMTVTFNVDPIDDPPILCEYTNYRDALPCGFKGCLGASAPNTSPYSTQLASVSNGTRFYDKSSSSCWLKESGNWRKLDPANVTDKALFITDSTINEKGVIEITDIILDEGGADPSENSHDVIIQSVTSSNINLVPISNIRFFYDGGNFGGNNAGNNLPITMNAGVGVSDDEKKFKIEVVPIGGQVGTATIELTVTETVASSPPLTFSFTVNINALSAQHGGWRSISSLGAKVNKFNNVLNATNVCTYNRSHCNTALECKGSAPPSGFFVPDVVNAVFYDQTNNKCYLSDGLTNTSWNEIQTKCNVSSSDIEEGCSSLGGSCIGSGAPLGLTLIPTRKNSFYWDKTNDKCYRSTVVGVASGWAEYSGTVETNLQWKSFTVSGLGTISGFNIYRRLAGEEFDYKSPINKVLFPATLMGNGSYYSAYLDNSANSFYAPVPNTVYYYEVRPVMNNIVTNTNDVFKIIRVLTPPNNRAFIHRWMVNQNICSLMQATSDPTNHYRCSYEGPGDTGLAAGTNFYDIGKDLIVDRFEAGCDYALPDTGAKCLTGDGSCIGIGDPNTLNLETANTNIGDLYYDRSTGFCHRYAGGSVWNELDANSLNGVIFANYNKPELPPLVNMRQERADNFCDSLSDITDNDILGLKAASTIENQLPTRKMQIAYSQWSADFSENDIQSIEQGPSLNVGSKCNSSNASGLSGYSDSQVPDSNNFYSIPGTQTSGIRSVMTGSSESLSSKGTETCSSRYGIQDGVGNISEWVADRIYCWDDLGPTTSMPVSPTPVFSSCRGVAKIDSLTPWGGITTLNGLSNDMIPGAGADVFDVYKLDGNTGPCIDVDDDGVCENPLQSWNIGIPANFATRWIVPMGLPIVTKFLEESATSVVIPFARVIGNSSGIEILQLHQDTMIFNTQFLRTQDDRCGAMAAGGSYKDGDGAGVWHFEFLPCNEPQYGFLEYDGFYYKDVVLTGGAQIEILKPAASTAFSISISGTKVTVELETDGDGNVITAPTTYFNNYRANAAAMNIAEIYPVSTNGSLAKTLSLTAVDKTTPKSKRVDVGFRCVAPVDYTLYDD